MGQKVSLESNPTMMSCSDFVLKQIINDRNKPCIVDYVQRRYPMSRKDEIEKLVDRLFDPNQLNEDEFVQFLDDTSGVLCPELSMIYNTLRNTREQRLLKKEQERTRTSGCGKIFCYNPEKQNCTDDFCTFDEVGEKKEEGKEEKKEGKEKEGKEEGKEKEGKEEGKEKEGKEEGKEDLFKKCFPEINLHMSDYKLQYENSSNIGGTSICYRKYVRPTEKELQEKKEERKEEGKKEEKGEGRNEEEEKGEEEKEEGTESEGTEPIKRKVVKKSFSYDPDDFLGEKKPYLFNNKLVDEMIDVITKIISTFSKDSSDMYKKQLLLKEHLLTKCDQDQMLKIVIAIFDRSSSFEKNLDTNDEFLSDEFYDQLINGTYICVNNIDVDNVSKFFNDAVIIVSHGKDLVNQFTRLMGVFNQMLTNGPTSVLPNDTKIPESMNKCPFGFGQALF